MVKNEKEYFLYLDESGNFEGEHDDRSLVGGVLCEANLADEKIADIIIEKIRKAYHADEKDFSKDKLPSSDYTVDTSFHHAVQLPQSIKSKVKLDMVQSILDTGYCPVIFQQEDTVLIQNSSDTYLVFMADGITKLLQDLSIDGPIKLNIIIGERVDTGKKNRNKKFKDGRNYIIRIDDIKTEIYKFQLLAKIKNPSSFPHPATIKSIKMGNDKHNTLLVLSDYICNFWYTKGYYYDGEDLDEYVKCRALEAQYKNRYSLRSMNLYSILNHYLDDQDYMEAMMLSMMADPSSYKLSEFLGVLKERFENLPLTALEPELDRYLSRFFFIVEVQRECRQALTMLDRTEKTLGSPEILREYYPVFMAKLQLWKMAASTHIGDLKTFEDASHKADQFVREAKDIDLYLMYVIRCSVNLQDHLAFDKSLELGREAVKIIKTLMEPLQKVESLTGRQFELYDDAYARICGTLVWTCALKTPRDTSILEEGRRYSEEAIRSFRRSDDKVRQYQYRAELEAGCGQITEALHFLELGIGIQLASDQADAYEDRDPFFWYHLSKVLVMTLEQGDEEQKQLAGIVFRRALPAWKKYHKRIQMPGHPDIITFTHMAICYAALGNLDPAIEMVKKAFESAPKLNSAILSAIGLTEHAVYLALLTRKGTVPKKEIEALRYELLEFNDKWPLKNMQSMFATWDAKLETIEECRNCNEVEAELMSLAKTLNF